MFRIDSLWNRHELDTKRFDWISNLKTSFENKSSLVPAPPTPPPTVGDSLGRQWYETFGQPTEKRLPSDWGGEGKDCGGGENESTP